MAKPGLEYQDSLPDVLGSIDYRLTFSDIPGTPGLDMERLVYDCTQAVIPGTMLNRIEQRFAGGHKLNFVASSTFSGTAAIQFIERSDGKLIRMMRRWHEFCRGTRTGNAQGYKRDYAVTGRLEVLDGPGNTVMDVKIRNMFPQEFPETQLDSSSEAQPILYVVSFSYDWWEIDGVPLT